MKQCPAVSWLAGKDDHFVNSLRRAIAEMTGLPNRPAEVTDNVVGCEAGSLTGRRSHEITVSVSFTSPTHATEPFLRSSYSRISQHFIEPEGSLPCSQEPSTGLYPESDQSNPYDPILSKIHFNIVHPLMPWSFQWSPSFWLSHHNPIRIPLLSYSFYMPCQRHKPRLDHSNYTLRGVQVMKLLIMQLSPTCLHQRHLKRN
jgi:hypothetical protein